MKNLYLLFIKHKKSFEAIIDSIFTICMTVFIALSHGSQDFVGTHAFKFFASTYLAFGILLYTLKNPSIKKLIKDITIKTFTIVISILIIAKLTNTINHDALYFVFYPTVIMVLYLFMNRKPTWVIDGENKRCTSREYLLYKHGKTVSIIPTLLLFTALIIPGLLNFPTYGFIISLLVAFVIEHLMVYILEIKYLQK